MQNKYGAKKTVCGLNHPHPSQLEASVCNLLSMRVKFKDIRNLKWIHTVDLGFGIRWKADFSFEQSPEWHLVIAEAKGVSTRDFALKLKMYRNGAGPAPLELWKGTARRPVLTEIIYPKGYSHG